MIDLEVIKAREKAASPGPWMGNYDVYDESSCGGGGFKKMEDEDFALNARADIPALIAEVERLRMALTNAERTGFSAGVAFQRPVFCCDSCGSWNRPSDKSPDRSAEGNAKNA